MALFADYRIMPRDGFKTGLNEVQVGLVVSPAIHGALVRTVGAHAAERMMVAGEIMSSEKAHAIGLVDELVDQVDDALPRAVEWCEHHIALPCLAMRTTRAMARADLHALFSDSSQMGVESFVNTWFSESTLKTLQGLVERLQNTSLVAEKRDEVAIDSVAMWRDHFWTGTGADTFFQAYVYGGYMGPDSLFYRHAHNDYLEIGTGFGFIGFALLGSAVLTSLWQSLLAQRRGRSRVRQGLGFASMMGISSILIHSFTDFNLHIPVNSLWFVVLLAFAWVAGTKSTSQKLN